MTKKCYKCNEIKDIYLGFYKNKSKRDGFSSECKKCADIKTREIGKTEKGRKLAAQRAKKYYDNNKKEIREKNLYKHYGITEEDFHALLVLQEGKCAICRKENYIGRGTWNVDHNHENKEVRGLLCTSCNRGLGYLGDNIEILVAAIRYLNNPPARKNAAILLKNVV